MHSWQTKLLGQVASINPSSISKTNAPISIKYLDISSVGDNHLTEPPKKLNFEDSPSRARRLVDTGDTLISTVRPGRKSRLFIAEALSGTVVSTGFAVIRGNTHYVVPRFLNYVLSNENFVKYLVSHEKGAVYPAVTEDIISSYSLLLPSLKEQKDIAEILGALDDKIELNRQMNATLEEIAQTIFKSWFIDFDPVHAKAEGRRPESMSEDIAALFPDTFEDSEMGRIPKGWQASKLGEYIDFIKGKKPETSNEYSSLTMAPHLLIAAFDGQSSEMVSTKNMILAEAEDVLMVMDGASSGRTETGFTGVVGSTIAKIKIISRLKHVLYFFLKIHESEINSQTTGTSIPHADKGLVNHLNFCFPKNEVLDSFNLQSIAVRKKININKQEYSSLQTLRDTLLPKLLSGEISVKAAEHEVSQVL